MTTPRSIPFLFVFFLTALLVNAQSDEGFEALTNGDYTKANSIFNSLIKKKKQQVPAFFGLATLQENQASPFFDLFEANKNIKACSKALRETSKKDKELFKNQGITSRSIRSLREKIAQAALELTTQKNHPRDWEKLIQRFGLSHQHKNIAKQKFSTATLSLLQSISSLKAANDTLQSYRRLLLKYDAGGLLHCDALILRKYLDENGWDKFEAFKDGFPNNSFGTDAGAPDYLKIVGTANLDDFDDFVKEYPYSAFSLFAKDSIQSLTNLYTKELESLQSALDGTQTYELASKLEAQYKKPLTLRMFSEVKGQLEQKQIITFVDENGWEAFKTFQNNHPKNRFAVDRTANSYTRIAASEKLEDFLNFEKAYPRSSFMYFAKQKINRLYAKRKELNQRARRAILHFQNADSLYKFHQNYRAEFQKYAPKMNTILDRKELDYFLKDKSFQQFSSFQSSHPDNGFVRDTIGAKDFLTIEGSKKLAEFEGFLNKHPTTVFRPLAADSVKHWKKYRDNLIATVNKAMKGMGEYEALDSVYQHFQAQIGDYAPIHREEVESRLLKASLREKGLDGVKSFVKDYPDNVALKEQELNSFMGTVGTGNLDRFRNFTYQYPNSPLNKIAEDSIKVLKQRQHQSTIAFSKIQSEVRPFIQKKDWKAALAELDTFKEDKGGDPYQFDKLVATLKAENTGAKPEPLSAAINNKGSVYLPSMTGDENIIYFCGEHLPDNSGKEDIFMSKKVRGKWMPPKLISELSTSTGNEAPLSVSSDGTRLLLFINGNLAYSDKTTKGWSKAKLFPSTINATGWQCDIMVTSDGKAMLFTANSAGYNMDIFISFKQADGTWGKPKLLGDKINTSGNDRSPFLHADMRTLYFSSDRHGSLGGLDVFKSERLGDGWDTWTEPVNLGKEINTVGHDWGYKVTTDGTKAYFAMDSGGYRYKLFEISLPGAMRPGQVTTIEGEIKGLADKSDTKVIVIDRNSGKEVAELKPDPKTGKYFGILPKGIDPQIKVDKEGVFTKPGRTRSLGKEKPEILASKGEKEADGKEKPDLVEELTQNQKIEEDIEVLDFNQESVEEMSLTFADVLFETDKYEIVSDLKPALDELAASFKGSPLKMIISGHTDDVGRSEYNQTLSQKRAEAVKQYLISKGCKAINIKAVGYGESIPIAPNDTEEGKAQNRRVEFRFEK